MAKKFTRPLLLDCASEVLTWVSLQDPAFAERIQIMRDERGYDDLQITAALIARTLDLGEHMCFIEREFMEPGYAGHLGPRTCQFCGAEFSPSRAVDLVCANQKCLDAQAAALDEQFEKGAKADA